MSDKQGWYGFDLDGTLAEYDHWRGETHIGNPIKKTVDKVKEFLAEGKTVKIFTARVAQADCNKDGSVHEISKVVSAIEDWCEKHIGQKLEITNKKDFAMIELWDDRSVQVIPNLGLRVDEQRKADAAIYAHAQLTLHNELGLYHQIVTRGEKLKVDMEKETSLWKVEDFYFVINKVAIFDQGQISEKEALKRFEMFLEDYSKNRGVKFF